MRSGTGMYIWICRYRLSSTDFGATAIRFLPKRPVFFIYRGPLNNFLKPPLVTRTETAGIPIPQDALIKYSLNRLNYLSLPHLTSPTPHPGRQHLPSLYHLAREAPTTSLISPPPMVRVRQIVIFQAARPYSVISFSSISARVRKA